MKKAFIAGLAILVASCAKDSSSVQEPGITDNLVGKLQRVEVVYPPQNASFLEQVYTYDDSGKMASILVRSNFTSGSGTTTTTSLSTFIRDQLGRAVRIVYTPATVASQADLVYRGTSNQLLYVRTVTPPGSIGTGLDSLVFTYNNLNQVVQVDQYTTQANGQLTRTGYDVCSWDQRGNLTSRQVYQDQDGNGIFEPSIKYSWTYDDKINPRPFTDPALFYWNALWPTGVSPNNVVRQMNTYPPNGGPDDALDYIFQYNPNNKPSTETQTPGGSITRYTYYQ